MASMKRDELGDLLGFLAVAEERSFTRAAARLGTSQSSLSHVVKRLEERLGIRLLHRTTRSVAPTEAGARLLETLVPAFAEVEEQLDLLGDLRDDPSGTLKITTSRFAAKTLLVPAVARLTAEHPDITVEISVSSELVDIAKEGFDAGIRLGDQVEKDMVAVRIGPELRMLVVAAPSYLERHSAPTSPRELTEHRCINLRLPTLGGFYAWELSQDDRPLNVRVDGPMTCNDPDVIIAAALEGVGLACLPDDMLQDYLEAGTLVAVLEEYCPPFPGFHLYYPTRHQSSAAFRLLVDALRYRG